MNNNISKRFSLHNKSSKDVTPIHYTSSQSVFISSNMNGDTKSFSYRKDQKDDEIRQMYEIEKSKRNIENKYETRKELGKSKNKDMFKVRRMIDGIKSQDDFIRSNPLYNRQLEYKNKYQMMNISEPFIGRNNFIQNIFEDEFFNF